MDQVPVSDLRDEYHIQPTLFYLWQRQALGRLSEVLQDGRTLRGQTQAVSADRARVAALEAKLAKKDAIIADSAEHLALKNGLGRTEEARRLVAAFVEYYKHQRLHSAIGFITPADMLAGRAEAIWAARDRKLEPAPARRRAQWRDPQVTSTGRPLALAGVH